MNYFLSDNSILKTVPQGEVYVTARAAADIGLETGDKITIEVEDVRKEFTMAGIIKDAATGEAGILRFIVSGEDFEAFFANETIKNSYGGTIYCIYTSDLESTKSEISEAINNFTLGEARATLEKTYVFDMMLSGILLVVSVILIAIAFVVLRFTTFVCSSQA